MGIHKTMVGFSGDTIEVRRKAYRHKGGKGQKREKTGKALSGSNPEAESMEAGERPPPSDKVELETMRLLDDNHIQKRRPPHLGSRWQKDCPEPAYEGSAPI